MSPEKITFNEKPSGGLTLSQSLYCFLCGPDISVSEVDLKGAQVTVVTDGWTYGNVVGLQFCVDELARSLNASEIIIQHPPVPDYITNGPTNALRRTLRALEDPKAVYHDQDGSLLVHEDIVEMLRYLNNELFQLRRK